MDYHSQRQLSVGDVIVWGADAHRDSQSDTQ